MKQTLEFSSHPENLACVRAFIREFLARIGGLPEKEAELIVLGIDEACANVIRHAYRKVPEQPIFLSAEMRKGTVRFKLRDYGRHAHPTELNGRPLDRIEPGGLGLHLIRHAFDQVDFNLKKSGTELVLVKRFIL
jgi:anti-sigma regulatory factor (Ser/Thr protein kinase)